MKYLDYENSSGEKGRTSFNYDGNNRLYRSFWTLESGARNSVNFYEYDNDGKLLIAMRDFSDGLRSTEKFQFDEEGNKISEFFFRSDSVSGSASYSYKNGHLIKAKLQNYKGWLSGDLFFHYNDLNQKSGAWLTRGRDTICSLFYDYDNAGNLIHENWIFSSGWSQQFNFIYEKNDHGYLYYSHPLIKVPEAFRIKEEHYSYNGESGGPSFYHYDIDGHLGEKEFIRSDGLSTFTRYEYDNEGRLKSSSRNYSDGGEALFTYTYDESDNLILRNFYFNDSLSGFEAYFYDPNGVLKQGYLRNFDNWLTGTLVFEDSVNYRIFNPLKPVYAKFIGENGFDADLTFKYDENENLVEIRWDFSFGKYQLYKFKYLHRGYWGERTGRSYIEAY